MTGRQWRRQFVLRFWGAVFSSGGACIVALRLDGRAARWACFLPSVRSRTSSVVALKQTLSTALLSQEGYRVRCGGDLVCELERKVTKEDGQVDAESEFVVNRVERGCDKSRQYKARSTKDEM